MTGDLCGHAVIPADQIDAPDALICDNDQIS